MAHLSCPRCGWEGEEDLWPVTQCPNLISNEKLVEMGEAPATVPPHLAEFGMTDSLGRICGAKLNKNTESPKKRVAEEERAAIVAFLRDEAAADDLSRNERWILRHVAKRIEAGRHHESGKRVRGASPE